MAYIGNQPFTTAFLTDQFSGNGTTTAFTLSAAPANTSSIIVAVTGVLQDPSTYSVTGTTLNFSAAPPSGTGNISVRFLGIPASGVTTTAYRTLTEFTATAGQTTFTPPSYTVGYINVFRNGVMLGTADYTASNGTTVVLINPASAGDLVVVESFYVSSVLNAIPATAGAVAASYLAPGAARTNFGAGAVLQVVSTIKTDSFSLAATNTFTDITGLSVAITPASATSKVLVSVSVGGASMSAPGAQAYRLVRGSTAIGVGTAAGSRQATSWRDFNGASDGNIAYGGYTFTFLDSPATTSSTTYKLQVAVQTGTGYINRSPNDTDTDAPWGSRPASTITVMEIAA